MADMFAYKPVTHTDVELFNKHRDAINAAVRSKIPSIPADFVLMPVFVRHVEACGTIHNYKVALPGNKFVKISFLTGGMVMSPPNQPDWKPPGPTISVDDSIKSTPDED